MNLRVSRFGTRKPIVDNNLNPRTEAGYKRYDIFHHMKGTAMPSVAVLVADGFETIECLTVVDILRRGGVRAALVSVMATRDVVSAQQVSLTCDYTFDEIDFDDFEYVVLPGGLPGTTNLRHDERVCDVVRAFAAERHVAAICAAPSILAELCLLYTSAPRVMGALAKVPPKQPFSALQTGNSASGVNRNAGSSWESR